MSNKGWLEHAFDQTEANNVPEEISIPVDEWANKFIKDIQAYVQLIKEEEEIAIVRRRTEQEWWDDFMAYMIDG